MSEIEVKEEYVYTQDGQRYRTENREILDGYLESAGLNTEATITTVISDQLGGEVRLTTEITNTSERTAAVFTDGEGQTQTNSHTRGFSGEDRVVIAGSPHYQSREAVGGFPNGTVTCEGHNQGGIRSFLSDAESVDATFAVIESVTRHRIAEFLERHPEIGAELERRDPAVTTLDGRPASLSELGEYPSQFAACPAGKPEVIVESLAK